VHVSRRSVVRSERKGCRDGSRYSNN
jgi:hypothetical protein